MQFGAVPFVPRESILRVLAFKSDHDPVPGHLGQDGCGGNAEALAVATNDGLLAQGDILQANTAVDEQVIRRMVRAAPAPRAWPVS